MAKPMAKSRVFHGWPGFSFNWSGRADLNRGPPAPEAVNETLSHWPV
jgi:hypothetical protein